MNNYNFNDVNTNTNNYDLNNLGLNNATYTHKNNFNSNFTFGEQNGNIVYNTNKSLPVSTSVEERTFSIPLKSVSYNYSYIIPGASNQTNY